MAVLLSQVRPCHPALRPQGRRRALTHSTSHSHTDGCTHSLSHSTSYTRMHSLARAPPLAHGRRSRSQVKKLAGMDSVGLCVDMTANASIVLATTPHLPSNEAELARMERQWAVRRRLGGALGGGDDLNVRLRWLRRTSSSSSSVSGTAYSVRARAPKVNACVTGIRTPLPLTHHGHCRHCITAAWYEKAPGGRNPKTPLAT